MKKFMFFILIMTSTLSLFAGNSGFLRFGAGGMDYMIQPLDLGELDTKLRSVGIRTLPDYMIMTGGGGWGYVGNSIRIGGYGASGSEVVTGNPGDINKRLKLTMHYGGVTIEKVFHPFNKSEISFGGMIGGGRLEIEVIQSIGGIDWDYFWEKGVGVDNADIPTDYHNYNTTMNKDFVVVVPSVGIKYNVLRWCALGVNVGYLYTVTETNWKMDNSKVYNVPKIDISNLTYRLNIYFGA